MNNNVEKIKEKAGNMLIRAGEELKDLDVGVALTKAQDFSKKLDLAGKKKAVEDYLDSPAMDPVKSAAITVKDFLGYVPYYAQSVPTMIKEALGKK